MELFSDSPKSFKIRKKNSPVMEKLKSDILEELRSDAVEFLAEYIIVFVSNGKNQFQAREALDAFLNERSGEFVSWLWNLLLKYAQEPDSDIHLVGTKGQAERVQRLESLIVNHNAPCQVLDRPGTLSRCVLPHITDNLQGKEVAAKRICSKSFLEDASTISSSSKKVRDNLQGKEIAAKRICSRSLLENASTISSPSKKVRDHLHGKEIAAKRNCSRSSREDASTLSSPRKKVRDNIQGKEIAAKRICSKSLLEDASTISSPSKNVRDNLYGKEIGAKRICSRSLLEDASTISSPSKKVRGSVWDRLGKPEEQKNVGMDEIAKYQVLNQHKLSPTQRTCTVSEKNSTSNVTAKDNFNGTNGTGRKRHFGEMSSGTSSHLVSSEKMDIQNKEILQAKRSPSTSRKEEMQSIKQKLHQAEEEIAKLRSKQMDVEKRAQSWSVLNAGMEKTSLEDSSSWTVLVTNVHFAATPDDIYNHFFKCGVILNITISTDEYSGRPTGSVYITFTDMESVDKAVALSGTSFFSRTLKIMKNTD